MKGDPWLDDAKIGVFIHDLNLIGASIHAFKACLLYSGYSNASISSILTFQSQSNFSVLLMCTLYLALNAFKMYGLDIGTQFNSRKSHCFASYCYVGVECLV